MVRFCSIEDCPRSVHARGWCKKHYRSRRLCSIEDCSGLVHARGWCSRHYQSWRKHGDPLGGGPVRHVGDEEARFWQKVDISGDCWEWQAADNGVGYGQFYDKAGKRVYAHRFAYELLIGSIPEGLHLDHLCRNTRCVNPDHLEPVTQAENNRRARKVNL